MDTISAPEDKKSLKNLIPARYIMAMLSSIGIAIIYGLKVNLSVAIVAMVNHTALAQMNRDHHGEHSNDSDHGASAECGSGDNSTDEGMADGPFAWSEPTQGLVLASYFWGYLISQFPGGRVAELFSAKWVMWGAVVVNVVFTLLTPLASYLSYIAVLAVRVIEGIGGGVTLPALHVMIARWTPPQERSRISAIVYAGTALGTVLSITLAGLLAGQINWEAVFYVMGGLSCIWCVLWIIFVYDGPDVHPRISEAEKTYILTSLGSSSTDNEGHHKSAPVPWRAVLTSPPFYAIMVAHTLGNFGWYMLLIELPTYMNQVLKFKIQENSGLSALPFLCMWIFSIIASNRLDWASSNKYITVTMARKMATLTASVIPGICLVAVSLVGCDRVLAVVFMTISVMCIGAMFSGYLANHIDIAPNYAGTLMAMTNTVATIPGFVVPVFVGQLTHGNQTVGQWQIIFCTTAALFGIEAIFYTIFGSGQEQPWNKVHQEKGTEEENTKM
ncbi:putative inorganic phosphate cotransporter isoform X2 [Ischnura elegans]|uniref:putative inorganic phosphate cotransporter isoform X2 n=1 Tax=Ischnura elegans TaxID=197161 RepID=UPI001ED88F1E|nr:putative inorganic phosphate cotransporter isoform X2 [Ischnura elegans]